MQSSLLAYMNGGGLGMVGEPARRELSLSMLRVEVRLYRRSRQASDTVQHPPHFEYLLRCDWSDGPDGPPRPATTGAVGGRATASTMASSVDQDADCWWSRLPQTYTVRRKWQEIAKFHEALVNEMAYDSVHSVPRTKTRPPPLPAKGDLDAFLLGVAAAGDACCLNGQKRAEGAPSTMSTMDEDCRQRSAKDLDDLRVIYVENRLMPYFRDVTKVLAEIDTEVLLESQALRRFITGRATVKGKPNPQHFGPRAVLLDSEETAAAAKALRKRYPDLNEVKGNARPSTTPAKSAKEAAEMPKVARSPQSFSMPASPSNKSVASPRSPTLKAGSAPSLQDCDGGSGPSGVPTPNGGTRSRGFDLTIDPEQDDLMVFDARASERDIVSRERRLATSHYGFFARALPDAALREFGHASQRDFWKRMQAKEQRELGRRTMLTIKKNGLAASAMTGRHGGRLAPLPPRGPHMSSRPASEPQLSGHHEKSRSRQKSPSILEMSGKTKDGGPSRDRICEINEDIREGLHVSILSEAASEEPHTKRMAAVIASDIPQCVHMPTVEESLKIYKKYQELHEMDGDVDNEDQSELNDDENNENEEDEWSRPNQSRRTHAVENGFALELLPISWHTFLGWVQREYDFASHFRYKAVCSALMRAVKRWMQWEANPSQRFYGVSLNMMLQWTFPGIQYKQVAQILTWIAHYELEHIRQPTPRVIEAQDRRQLEGIYKVMDPKGRGYCTAEDIAGGTVQDMSQRLKNIVDVDTVKNVCGDGKMTQEVFLELFCEDNCRAHETSKTAMLRDGSKLVQVEHAVVGFTGWIYEISPKEEERQRLLITALEAEVLRWKKMASRKTKLHEPGTIIL